MAGFTATPTARAASSLRDLPHARAVVLSFGGRRRLWSASICAWTSAFGSSPGHRAGLGGPSRKRRFRGAIVLWRPPGGPGAYCATKFALEGLTETLSDEVRPFGIQMVIVEPGAFRTGLFAAGAPVEFESDPLSVYADTVAPTRAYVQSGDGTQPGDPRKAAAVIADAVDANEPPLRLVLGEDAIENVRARLGRLGDELSRWEATGRDTALDPG